MTFWFYVTLRKGVYFNVSQKAGEVKIIVYSDRKKIIWFSFVPANIRTQIEMVEWC